MEKHRGILFSLRDMAFKGLNDWVWTDIPYALEARYEPFPKEKYRTVGGRVCCGRAIVMATKTDANIVARLGGLELIPRTGSVALPLQPENSDPGIFSWRFEYNVIGDTGENKRACMYLYQTRCPIPIRPALANGKPVEMVLELDVFQSSKDEYGYAILPSAAGRLEMPEFREEDAPKQEPVVELVLDAHPQEVYCPYINAHLTHMVAESTCPAPVQFIDA